MGIFTKKEEIPKIPSIPALPKLPELESSEPKKELPELPSFPSNSKNDSFNQEMLKSAVSDMPSPRENEVHAQLKTLPVVERKKEESMIPPSPPLQNTISSPPKIPSTPQLPSKSIKSGPTTPPSPKLTQQQGEPIFIRIDKFQASQKNFETIKSKIEEIESVLKKINDVKLQEEEELKDWAEDIEKIKSRLAEIDDDIFSQI